MSSALGMQRRLSGAHGDCVRTMYISNHSCPRLSIPQDKEIEWSAKIDSVLEGWDSTAIQREQIRENVLEVNQYALDSP